MPPQLERSERFATHRSITASLGKSATRGTLRVFGINWVIVCKIIAYLWITNIQAFSRELSGPRPLRWIIDIGSKLCIWDRSASTVSLETQLNFQITETAKGRNHVLVHEASPRGGATQTLDCRVSPACGVEVLMY